MSAFPVRLAHGLFMAVLLCTPVGASASSSLDLGEAARWNALVEESFSAPSSDVEGRLAAGGNVAIDHYSIGDKLGAGDSTVSLLVGGDLVFPDGRIHEGSVHVAGSAAGLGQSVRSGLQPHQQLVEGQPLPFAMVDTFVGLRRLSAGLANVPANGTSSIQSGTVKLTGDCRSGLQVFALDGQALLDANGLELNCVHPGMSVLINVSGSAAGLTDMSLEALAPHQAKTLFNFHAADTLTLTGVAVRGSVLAPNAQVEQPQGVLHGTLMARSWNGAMQLNHVPFQGQGGFDRCDLYPIALPQSVIDTTPVGGQVHQMPRGTGAGNYSWLSWTGANDAPTLAASLAIPGDSWRWTNPDDAGDLRLDPTDWIEGAPGSMNSSAVRAKMDALIGKVIHVPVFDQVRGQGANLDYRMSQIARIVPTAYRLNGQGWLSFRFEGLQDCANRPPLASDLEVSVTAGESIAFTLAAHDPDGDALAWNVLDAPASGSLGGTAPELIYSAAADFSGEVSFRYQVSDSTYSSAEAQVRIQVLGPDNAAPQAQDASHNLDENGTLDFVLNASDPNGDTLTFEIVEAPVNGVLSGTAPNLSYTPNAGFSGSDTLRFRVSDGALQSEIATVGFTINAINHAPVVQGAALTLDEDGSVAFVLQASDPDGDTLTFEIVEAPVSGVLSGTAPNLSYTPNAGFSGSDTLRFRVSDGALQSGIATVTFTVNAINHAPVITSTPPLGGQVDQVYNYPLEASDSDGDALQFLLELAPAGAAIDALSGMLSWTPQPGQVGSQDFVVQVHDIHGASVSQSFTVQVEAGNAAPQIVSIPAAEAINGETFVYPVQAQDPNPADTLSYSLLEGPAQASIDEVSGTLSLPMSSAYPLSETASNPWCARSDIETGNRPPFVDLVVLMDESTSMQGEQLWIRDLIPRFDIDLRQYGVGLGSEGANSYGLIGFGRGQNGDTRVHTYPDGARMGAIWDWYALSRVLQPSGQREDPFPGLMQLAEQFPLRGPSARAAIFVGDNYAGRDPASSVTEQQVIAALNQAQVTAHAVIAQTQIRCGDGREAFGIDAEGVGYLVDSYGQLAECTDAVLPPVRPGIDTEVRVALETGGSVWRLEVLRAGGEEGHRFERALRMAITRILLRQKSVEWLADVTVASVAPAVLGDSSAMDVEVINRGRAASGAFELVATDAQGTELHRHTFAEGLTVGAQEAISFALPDETVGTLSLRVEMAADQCDLANDRVDVPVLKVAVTDPHGLSDTQRFVVTARNPGVAPVISSLPPATVRSEDIYRYAVTVADADHGDAVALTLVQAPFGMQLAPFGREIVWIPDPDAVGSHPVVLRATDLAGHVSEQTFMVEVAGRSQPLRIPFSSTPPTKALIGENNTYAAELAAVPLGVQHFDLHHGDAAMQLDAQTGVLAWSPADSLFGRRIYTLIVLETDQAEYAYQEFEYAVDRINAAPRILNAHADTAASASYLVNSTFSDPNAFDSHSWSLLRSPAGAVVNPSTGLLSWTAPAFLPQYGDGPATTVHNAYCSTRAQAYGEVQLAPGWSSTGQTPSQPVVGALRDSNADGVVDDSDALTVIVVEGGSRNAVVARDALNGAVLWEAPLPGASLSVVPAIVDLDGDGEREVLAWGGPYAERRMYAFDANGQLLWISSDGLGGGQDLMSSAIIPVDLKGDGVLTLLAGPFAFDAQGQLLRRNPGGLDTLPLPVDLDNDGELEILIGQHLIGADGALRWSFAHADGMPIHRPTHAVGDVNGDGAFEIVLQSRSAVNGTPRMVVIDAQGQRIAGPATPRSIGGTPVLADVDGDGTLEIFNTMTREVFSAELILLSQGSSAGASPSAIAADLNGDGRPEYLAHGSSTTDLFLLDGVTGRHRAPVYLDQHVRGGAFHEQSFPLLLDLDRDGLPEVLRGAGRFGSARVLGHRWQGLPTQWLSYWGLDSTGRGPAARLARRVDAEGSDPVQGQPAADLWLGRPRISRVGNAVEISVAYANRGAAPVPQGTVLELRAGWPASDGGLWLSTSLPALWAAQQGVARWTVDDPDTIPDLFYASVDPLQAVPDCERANNTVLGALFQPRVTDAGGLFDERFYALGQSVTTQTPRFASVAPSEAYAGETWRYRPQFSGTPGSGFIVRIISAPAGVEYSTVSGEISWRPAEAQIGTHRLIIDVTLSSPFGTQQTIDLTVLPARNHAPTITSTPATQASAGSLWTYTVQASDPDGDMLSFELLTASAGASIDPVSGLLQWTPAESDVGTHAFEIRVSDGRGGEAVQSFELVVSEAGVNQPPQILSAPANTAKVGREYRYPMLAEDADGDVLNYVLMSGPSGMQIDAASGVLIWTPAEAGTVDVSVRVDDGEAWQQQDWTIEVLAAEVPLLVDVSVTPTTVDAGGTVEVTTGITGAAGPISIEATLAGAPIEIAANAGTPITAPQVPGCVDLLIEVSDGHDVANNSAQFCVADPNDADAPIVALLGPDDNAEITAPSVVRARVEDASLAHWRLYRRPANSPSATPTLLAQGSDTFADAQIHSFDPTLLINGQYSLILQATDTSGRVSTDSVVVRVTGEMKVGHFQITFEDVSLPLAGIPIRVTRTYDTRQRDESLDFGMGWSVDYQNVRLRESAKAGFSWRTYQTIPGQISDWCTVSNGDRVVTVTLPDGAVESFRAKVEPECTFAAPENNVHLVYEPIDGTDSTLEQTNYGLLQVLTIGGSGVYNVVDPEAPGDPVDPRNYRLTTPEGLVYEIDQFFGVRRVIEPNGQSLTYSDAGIVHSTGVGVAFERDAQGRIEAIVLPDGERIEYAFTADGDLDFMRDAVEQLTRFSYKAGFPHYLEAIFDPRGVRAIRNEYDDDGRLTATIDADGHRIEYTHDIEGRTEQIRDRRQHLLTYVYDEEGRVLTESNHLGETIQHQYDADGNEVLRIDPLLNRTTWTHDARGNVLTETNAENETTTREYDSRNNLLVEYDAANVPVIRNQYRPNTTLLTSMTDALDQVTSFGYDIGDGTGNTGELDRMRDAGDGWTTFEIDHRGWRVAETDALDHVTDYTHDAMGRVLTETTSRTKADGSTETLVTSYTYDDKGRLIRTTYPDNTFSTTEYNAIDKPERECDVLNRCTVTQYDDSGNVERIDYPDGTFETKEYDPNGNLIEETDRAGRTTRHRYDAADRLFETIHPDNTPEDDTDNPRSRSEYDAAGRLTVSIDARGARTRYGYDNAGRRTTVTDALEHTSTTVYDNRGRRERVIDALNRVTRFVYDEAGRLIETIHPDAHVPSGDDGVDANNPRSRTDYDALGRKIAQTDELGRTTRYAYDKLGRLIAVALPNADTGANPPLIQTGETVTSPDPGVAITRYRYDERGNKIAQIDAMGRTTQWEFDAMGRETARVLPMGQRETFAYDELGNREHHVDFNGLETHYEYDSVNRLTRIDHPDQPDVLISYTASGQRESVTDAHGITVYDYDAQDRLIRIDSPDGRWIAYAYDAVGNRIELRTQNQHVHYGFDALNRLASVRREGETAVVTYTYDAVGNRDELSHPNGTRSVYRYDARNRLSQLSQIGLGGVLLLGMSYEVDAIGLRQSIAEQHADGRSRVSTYQYDALRRLIDERINDSLVGNLGHHWTYDAVGNRLTQVTDDNGIQTTRGYQVDANDRLLDVTENGQSIESYTYDPAGNTRTKTDLSGLTEYAWNSEGRLIEQRSANGTVQFGYNAEGIRIHSQTVGGVRTEYLIDPNQAYAQVVEEHQGALRTNYLHGDDLLAQIRSVESLPGDPAAEDLRWFHYDGLGSTRLLSDDAGIPTDHYAYTAFGELIEQASQTPTDNPYRYTGEQWDENLGMYYLRARYMEPGSGRFWGMDAFSGYTTIPTSLHKFTYASGDPANNVDPSGNETLISQGMANNIGVRLMLLATIYATSCALEYGITSTYGSPATPAPDFGCRRKSKTYYHYSTVGPASFARGLWSGSAGTTLSGLDAYSASQGLGIPLPVYEYPVTINPDVTRVSPISIVAATPRYTGGLPQVFFPMGTPPGSVGPFKIVPQVP